MKKKFLIAFAFFALAAQSQPEHMVWCNGISVNGIVYNIGLRLPLVTNPKKPTGTFQMAQVAADESLQTLIDTQAPKTSVTFASDENGSILDAIVNLGRSGTVNIHMTKLEAEPGGFTTSQAVVRSTLRKLSIPDGMTAECFYFFSSGPKPGMSGSN